MGALLSLLIYRPLSSLIRYFLFQLQINLFLTLASSIMLKTNNNLPTIPLFLSQGLSSVEPRVIQGSQIWWLKLLLHLQLGWRLYFQMTLDAWDRIHQHHQTSLVMSDSYNLSDLASALCQGKSILVKRPCMWLPIFASTVEWYQKYQTLPSHVHPVSNIMYKVSWKFELWMQVSIKTIKLFQQMQIFQQILKYSFFSYQVCWIIAGCQNKMLLQK